MKCHCGLECEMNATQEQDAPYHNPAYFRCPTHGFQGWINTEGFEYLD